MHQKHVNFSVRSCVLCLGPILEDTNTNFELMPLSPMPAFLNVNYICETASRLLFLSMHWSLAIKAFTVLEYVRIAVTL